MKSLKSFIIESAKTKFFETTVGKFFAWYVDFSEDWNDIDAKDAEDVFDNNDVPELNDFNNVKEFVKFINDNKDKKIKVKQEQLPNVYDTSFEVDGKEISLDTVSLFGYDEDGKKLF